MAYRVNMREGGGSDLTSLPRLRFWWKMVRNLILCEKMYVELLYDENWRFERGSDMTPPHGISCGSQNSQIIVYGGPEKNF